MIWADVSDPAVYSAIVTDCSDPGFDIPTVVDTTVEDSLRVASTVLTALSGRRIHPAGTATDDFRAVSSAHRLTPNFQPLKTVISAFAIRGDCEPVELETDAWCVRGRSLYFGNGNQDFGTWYRTAYACRPAMETISVTYTFGSTVSAAAMRAVLFFARQVWLACHPDADGTCQLPDRITSVNREGLSYTLLDPMTFLDKSQTGLPSVDIWLAAINPSKARRPAGIYTPDSPPPVNRHVVAVL